MTRITRVWGALAPEQRLATVAAVALLVTMFLPWYDLQSLDRKSGVINSHSISAFGDVSFVEAAVFLVAAGVIALMLARAERRDFHMPGSDGAVVMAAGCWAALLIFYRVFSRPAGHGYPVGIQWGFFLAFVAAGTLALAGWRMRAVSVPEAPLLRGRGSGRRRPAERPHADEDVTVLVPQPPRAERAAPVATPGARPSHGAPPVVELGGQLPPSASPETTSGAQHSPSAPPGMTPSAQPPPRTTRSSPSPHSDPDSTTQAPPGAGVSSQRSPRPPARTRPRFPPAPSDQLSFEDPPPFEDRPSVEDGPPERDDR